jgi:integrase
MEQLSSVLKFAKRFQHVWFNVAEGLKVEDPVDDVDKRNPFTIGDLQKMFAAPLYTGCINDEQGFKKPGPNVMRRARFWCPLLALFSSMRLNEICQLTVNDIQVIDGVPAIVLKKANKDGKKKLKTSASARKIPIHPELKKIGFLDYVEKIRKTGEIALFPELKPATGLRYKSDQMSAKLNRFIDSLNVEAEDEQKDFHSFRHTLATAMKRAGLPYDARDELGGWAKAGTRAKVYEARYSAQELYDFLSKVEYPGLNLSHLYI